MEKISKKLKVFVKECKWYPCCPMKYFYENGKLDIQWINRYCRGNWKNCVRYRKEEKGEYHPNEMLPDGTVDKSLLM